MKKETKYLDDIHNFPAIYYQKLDDGFEHFYLFDITTIQVLSEFDSNEKIEVKNITYFDPNNNHNFNYDYVKSIKTVKDYILYILPFAKADTFYFVDIELLVGDRIKLTSHDDEEVDLFFPQMSDTDYLNKLFNRFGYPELSIDKVREIPNKYLKISKPGIIIDTFEEFFDLLDTFK